MFNTSDDKKSKERLKKFQTQKNIPKKWKSLRKILDKESSDNVKQFWKAQSEEIIACLIAYETLLEGAKDTEKAKKTHDVEVAEILKILQQLFHQLRPALTNKWKFKDIRSLLSRLLAKQNKHFIRKAAFDMNCLYCEIILDAGGGTELDELVQLLAQGIGISVFLSEVQNANPQSVKNCPTVPSVQLALSPSNAEVTLNDSLELFDLLLGYLGHSVTAGHPKHVFEWWFNVIKVNFMTIFYPDACKKCGFLDITATTGFPYCPPSVQGVIISRFELWKDIPAIEETFFSDQHAILAMDIFRQACDLPISHHSTILKAIETWKCLLVNHIPSHLISSPSLQIHWRDLISIETKLFVIQSTPAECETHTKIISNILPVIDTLTSIHATMMSEETWKHLQVTFMTSAMDFLKKNSSHMLSDGKNDVAKNADEIFSHLFASWIRSPITTPEMWNAFHVYVMNLSDWPHLIRQWRAAVIKLTHILCQYAYFDEPINIIVIQPTLQTKPSIQQFKATSGRDSINLGSGRTGSVSTLVPPLIPQTSSSSLRVGNNSQPLPSSSSSYIGTNSQPGSLSKSPSSLLAQTSSSNDPGQPHSDHPSTDINHNDSINLSSINTSSSNNDLASTNGKKSTINLSLGDRDSSSPQKRLSQKLDTNSIAALPGKVFEVTREQLNANFFGVFDWNYQKIYEMWHTILHIVGNLNHIRSALNFELAMRCVSDVITLLLIGEEKVSPSNNPRRIPPLPLFFPWLIEACYATGEKIRGVIIAFQSLCQLLCCQHSKSLSLDVWAHFYRVMQVGLKNDNTLVKDQILTEARHIFAFDLPGSTILIPDLLTEIANTFKSRVAVPDVQKHAITILNSLICFANHYKGIDIPDWNKINAIAQTNALSGTPPGPDPVLTSIELRDTVTAVITTLLSNSMDAGAKCCNLWGASIMLFEELTNPNPRMSAITSTLNAMFTLTKHAHDGVALTATHVLYSLSDLFDEFNRLDKNLTFSIIGLFSDAISAVSQTSSNGTLREGVIASLYEGLAAWVVAGPNDFLRDRNLAAKVFGVIEIGLFGQPVDATRSTYQTPTRLLSDEESVIAPVHLLIHQLREKPTHNSTAIKNAAESALYSLLEMYNNWPTPAGACSIDSSDLAEIPELPTAFFTNYAEQIISIQILRHPDQSNADNMSVTSSIARVIIRDSMGKHAWDFALDLKEHNDRPKHPMFDDPVPTGTQVPPSDPAPKKTDFLSTLLSKYDDNHSDILPQHPKFTKFTLPCNPDTSYKSEIENIINSLAESQATESTFDVRYEESRPQVNHIQLNEPSPVSHMTLARLVLLHFGYLSPFSRRDFHMLEDSPELRKKLEEIDSMSSRFRQAVSVRYIPRGLESTQEILDVNHTSSLFNEFTASLGWKVDAHQHSGFKGNLTAEEYPSAVYRSSTSFEHLFELLPNIKTQEAKKLSLEMNQIEIVFSEHTRDYSPVFPHLTVARTSNDLTSSAIQMPKGKQPATIPGASTGIDFSFGVYPLASGLFRVVVHKREQISIGMNGPLTHGAVVSKNLLAPLLTCTTGFTHRRLASLRQDHKHPRVARMAYIRSISQEHRALKAGEIFFSNLYPLIDQPDIAMCSISNKKVIEKGEPFKPQINSSVRSDPASTSTAASPSQDPTADHPIPTTKQSKHFPQRSYGVSRSAGFSRSISELHLQKQSQTSSSVPPTTSTSSVATTNIISFPSPSITSTPPTTAVITMPELSDFTPPPFEASPFDAIPGTPEPFSEIPPTTSITTTEVTEPPPIETNIVEKEPNPSVPEQKSNEATQPSPPSSDTPSAPTKTIPAPNFAGTHPRTDSVGRGPSASKLTANFKQSRPPITSIPFNHTNPTATTSTTITPATIATPAANTTATATPVPLTEGVEAGTSSPAATSAAIATSDVSSTTTPETPVVATTPVPITDAPVTTTHVPPVTVGTSQMLVPGPSKLPSGFKVPFGVAGSFKVPIGLAKVPAPLSGPKPPQ